MTICETPPLDRNRAFSALLLLSTMCRSELPAERNNPLFEQTQVVLAGMSENGSRQCFGLVRVTRKDRIGHCTMGLHGVAESIGRQAVEQVHIANPLDRRIDDMGNMIEFRVCRARADHIV